MYETLEGRLKWDQTEKGIRIVVPVRRGPFLAVYAPLVIIWLALATIRYWHVLQGPHSEDLEFTLQMVSIGLYVVGAIYFVSWMAWTTSGETLVTLNPPEVKIQTRVFGIELASRKFQTHQINRMRFIPPTRLVTQPSVINPNSSSIRFESNNRSQDFAKGVSESEARALIDKMLMIYEFPRSWF